MMTHRMLKTAALTAALFAAGSVAASARAPSQSEFPLRTTTQLASDASAIQIADRRGRDRTERVVSREVCEDVEVTERRERDGNAGGTIAGAVIGGLLGNQIGSGSGRKAATVAGAVAGGYAGNRIDRNHDGGKRRTHVERQCHQVYDDGYGYRR